MADLAQIPQTRAADYVRRHNPVTRIWHWANVGVFVVLLMSGLAIFNAHPRLYWGSYGANPDPAWLEIGMADDIGYLRIGKTHLDMTGVLGVSSDAEGHVYRRAFPGWATLPASGDLAMARRWHLTFAWLLLVPLIVYALWSLIGGHLWRDLIPARRALRPGALWHVCCEHARLRFPRGNAAACYNPLQQLSYLAVALVFLPGMVLTGLAMAPAATAVAPWLLDLSGGRQSARALHFLFAAGLVSFVILHIAMILLAGPWNHVRSMITGRYRLPPEIDP